MELYDVVTKLIGPIQPIGETTEDEKRFNNLKEMTDLIDQLLTEVDRVASCKNISAYSIKHAGEFADKFMRNLGIQD